MSKPLLNLSFPWLPASDVGNVVCCMCNGTTPRQEVFRFNLNGVLFTILHCIQDDLMYLSPQPGEVYATALYNHPSYFLGGEMYGHAISEQKGRAIGDLRLDEMEAHGGLPSTFLEIGCGLGFTLQTAKEHGVNGRGIEFSEASVEACRARGLEVSLGKVDIPVPQEIVEAAPYDVIALYSVLEHVPNPKQFLSALRPLLHSESRLIIRVPRMSIEGPWVSLLDHFWHFTEISLERLLESEKYSITNIFPSGTFITPSGKPLTSMTIFAKPL